MRRSLREVIAAIRASDKLRRIYFPSWRARWCATCRRTRSMHNVHAWRGTDCRFCPDWARLFGFLP